MSAVSTTVVVAGAGGAQGLALARYIRMGAPEARIIALDRAFSATARRHLETCGCDLVVLDILGEPERLAGIAAEASIVVNLAGPFYALGDSVLNAAIRAGTRYLDICDDVDATAQLLARHEDAVAGGCRALIGMGSAPGTTNLLVKLAMAHLGAEAGRCEADIAWCAPDSDLTFGIFQHLVHCFKTALPGAKAVPDWDDLEPKAVMFPDPIGVVEVVRLGHPEPLTLERFLGCSTILRGGMTSDGLLRRAWAMARACDQGLEVREAWTELEPTLAAEAGAEPGHSGMLIDITADRQGLRFESATRISMEQSTAVPAAAVVLMMLSEVDAPFGVWPPEVLEPAAFFDAAGRVSPGGGGLRAFRLLDGAVQERISLRSLMETR